MTVQQEAQQLANRYATAIKEIRLLFRDSPVVAVFTPAPLSSSSVLYPQNFTIYQHEFNEFTEEYRDMVREVRVIFRNGAGASQFFPKGTPEREIWVSIIPKEELNG